MPPWTKMLGDWTGGREKPLSVARGLEFLQALLPLACRLVRVVKLSEGIAPFAGLQNRACRRVGGQRVRVCTKIHEAVTTSRYRIRTEAK